MEKDKQMDLEEIIKSINSELLISPKKKDVDHEERIRAIAKDIINRSRLTILIWGPGSKGDPELYKKRVQIRDELRKLGHKADFSENNLTQDALIAGGLNLCVSELIQALSYEYIVCIMSSPGSIAEVHDFCHIPHISIKMMICIDKDHLDGYSGKGKLKIFEGNHGRLEKFSYPEDIDSCNLCTKVLEQVEKRAAAKQFEIAKNAGSL